MGITRWAASSTSSRIPPRPKTLDVKAQYGSRNTPKLDFIGSARLGQAGRHRRWQRVRHRRISDRARERARQGRQQRVGEVLEPERRSWTTTPNDRVHAFVRVGYFDENRDNGKASTIDGTEEANDTTWRDRTAAACGSRTARVRAIFRRPCSPTSKPFTATFSPCRRRTRRASIGRMTLIADGADRRMSVEWCSGRARSARSSTSRAGTDFRWVDGDSLENGLDAQTGTQVTLKRNSGGTQRSAGLFRAGLIVPTPQLTLTLSARVDWLAELQRSQPRERA